MGSREHPSYSVIKIDLTAAGERSLPCQGEILHFADATKADGSQYLDAKVLVQLGRTDDDKIPLRINGKIKADVLFYLVSWDAQPGVTAELLIASDYQRGAGVDFDGPTTKQIVTSSVGTNLTPAAVNVDATAGGTVLAAASALRQSVTIQNLGANDIYVGGAGVTTANGTKVAANGGSLTLDKTTAEVRAITAAGASDVRVLVEA